MDNHAGFDTQGILNKQPFADLAALCRRKPGVWTTVRESQSSANLVTRIRKGEVEDFPIGEFKARSSRYVNPDGTRYDIEVMCLLPESDDHEQEGSSPTDLADLIADVMQDAGVQKAIRIALAKLLP